MVRTQWQQGMRSWRFWVTVGLTVFLFALTIQQYASAANVRAWSTDPQFYNFYTVTLAALGTYPESLWIVFVPVLATLPAGDILARDRRRGVDATVVTRIGWNKYLWGQLIANATLACGATALAIAVTLTMVAMRYPITLPKFLGWRVDNALPYRIKVSGVFGNTYGPTFHPHFFWAHPGLYVTVVIVVALWATMTLASLATAAGVWLRRPILTLAVPTALFWLGDFVASMVNETWAPSVMAGGYLAAGQTPSWVLALYWGIPALAVVVVITQVTGCAKEWPSRSMEQ